MKAIQTSTIVTTKGSCGPSAAFIGMKSHADFTFADLVNAYLDCRQHKRNTRSARAFEMRLGDNLDELYEELAARTYYPGTSICFVVTRPKAREVWAAQFRDRVVQHLLYNAIAPRFLPCFIADSCACIPERGTLYAAERLESKIRSVTQNWKVPAHYLKADLANFFVSIDKKIVWKLLVEKITEPFWRWLAEIVLFHDPRRDFIYHGNPALLDKVPAHKRLMNWSPQFGMAIGNLFSQFVANLLLNELDQFVKHTLCCKHYIRYVDDFVLLHNDPRQLTAWLAQIEAMLPARLHVRLNPSKTIVQPVSRGVDFVGQSIRPHRRTIRRRTIDTAIQRIRIAEAGDLFATGNSYLGLARQASHSRNDQARIAKELLRRGHAVDFSLNKIYRRAT